MRSWEYFSDSIRSHGVIFCYENCADFNHPPLAGYVSALLRIFSDALGVRFAVVFKMVPIIGDVLALSILLTISDERKRRFSIALFSLSPGVILISAYHGNTDSLMISLCLLAAYMFESNNFFSAGLSVAAAVNVKLIPVVFGGALAVCCRSRAAFFRYALGVAIGVIPFLFPLIASPRVFYQEVLNYDPNRERWGINLFLSLAFDVPHIQGYARSVSEPLLLVARGAIPVVCGCIALLARRWRWDAYSLGIGCFGVFLSITPGFGIQYVLYGLPFFLISGLVESVSYAVLASVFTVVIYVGFWDGGTPFFSHFTGRFSMLGAAVGSMLWMTIFTGTARHIVGSCRAPRGAE